MGFLWHGSEIPSGHIHIVLRDQSLLYSLYQLPAFLILPQSA